MVSLHQNWKDNPVKLAGPRRGERIGDWKWGVTMVKGLRGRAL